jgi:two-component system, NarL family, nitrate/nitrite response regulator NarL
MTAAESERPLRVLVADDHPPTRDYIRRALERAGAEVRGEASNAAEAVRAALACYPDICLLDLNMPGQGMAAVWEINARLPTTKVVILTVSEDEADIFAALRAGAASYLVKNIDFRRLAQALRDIHEGRGNEREFHTP